MTFQNPQPVVSLFMSLLGVLVFNAPAFAEGNGRTPPLLPKFQQECSSCHVAYSPSFLPAASWARIFSHLPKHFGVDASMDAASTQELADWAKAHAGTGQRAKEQPPEDRITRAAWFARQHDEVAAATWRLAAVKSAANCAACHRTAEQGDFNERNVRIPR